jgi:hypothetical protein
MTGYKYLPRLHIDHNEALSPVDSDSFELDRITEQAMQLRIDLQDISEHDTVAMPVGLPPVDVLEEELDELLPTLSFSSTNGRRLA